MTEIHLGLWELSEPSQGGRAGRLGSEQPLSLPSLLAGLGRNSSHDDGSWAG